MNNICKCDTPTCAKCLLVACQDDNCPIHTTELKIQQRRYRMSSTNVEYTQQLEAEIEKLKNVRMAIKKPL